MSNPWDAPQDNSGGFFTLLYSNGTYSHRMRAHINPFNGTTLAYTTATGTEVHVNDTCQALINLLKPMMHTTWAFTVLNLYQNVSGTLTELFGTSLTATGTGTSATADPIMPAGELILNFKTANGGKARNILIGSVLFGAAQPVNVTGSSGGDATQQALVAYLTGSNTQIVGHDGGKLLSPARLTYPVNRRLRRHYGMA